MSGYKTRPKSIGSLPRELRWFLFLSLVLWICSVAYVALRLRFAHGDNHGLPPVLLNPPFGDLYAFADKLKFVHQPEFFKPEWGWNYSAPCIFLYKLLYLFVQRRHGHIIYVLIVITCLFPLTWNMAAELKRRGLSFQNAWLLLIGTALMSWPILLGIHQGNTDTLIWMGVAIGVWAYYRDMWWTAAILIGMVAALKIYPILLIALFFPPKKYLQAAGCALTFAIVTIASLAYIGPSIPAAYGKISGGVKLLTDLGFYPKDIDRDYLTFDHSLVSLIRICTINHLEAMKVIFHYYLPVAGALMAIFFVALIWKMPRANQVLVVVLASVLLPPKSYDYTLEMIYIPWAWLALLSVQAAASGRTIKGMMPVMICFALVCSPELFFKFQGYYSYGQLKTVVLLAMLGLAGRYPFDDGEPNSLRQANVELDQNLCR
jgi:Glycosyltransferase family 87